MKYYALKAYQERTDQDAPKHKLAVQRAKLGMVTSGMVVNVPPEPKEAHDSSAVYLSGGHNESLGDFYAAKLRPVFHDLEQFDAGMVQFSHIEVLSTELRYYPRDDRYSIHKITLLNLLNSTPLTKLDKSFSWRARMELLDAWTPHFEGGVGTSLEIAPWMRLIQLMNVKYYDSFVGAGPNFILAFRLGKRLGASIDAGYYFGWDDRRLWDLRTRLDYQLARNWDLQFEHLNQREMQGKILYNFLF
jgi:hypothetical protein